MDLMLIYVKINNVTVCEKKVCNIMDWTAWNLY